MVRPSKNILCDCHGGQRSVWWMLLSHHAPCDLGRTWSFLGVHICVRCFAVVLSIVLTLGFKSVLVTLPQTIGWWIPLLCVLLAWIDFALGELWRSYPRTNVFRFFTGALFGWSAGCCLVACYDAGDWLPLLCFVGMFVMGEILVAFLFFYCGHLESYLEKYEKAVGLKTHNCDCHHHK